MVKVPPRENLIDTIEFNFYQDSNNFDPNFWYNYIDEIEDPLYSEIAKLKSLINRILDDPDNNIKPIYHDKFKEMS